LCGFYEDPDLDHFFRNERVFRSTLVDIVVGKFRLKIMVLKQLINVSLFSETVKNSKGFFLRRSMYTYAVSVSFKRQISVISNAFINVVIADPTFDTRIQVCCFLTLIRTL
jgi:hypothetical protein